MKKIISILVLLYAAASFAYPIPKAFPPFKIADNLYYVGTDDLASYLIVTPNGNILINSNLEVNVPMLKESIERLGFKYSDTKILLISHAHLDHAEGSKRIIEQTHAKYMVMDKDVALIQSGGLSDFQYAEDSDMHFPPVKVNKVLHDGDRVTLGGVTLVAHLTAGHTPGCTSWTMTVRDKGKQKHVVIVGSLNVNPGYQLVDNKNYPDIADDYRHAIATLTSLPCDIFLGAHAGYFNLQKKYDMLVQSEANPFIDPKGYKQHIAIKKQEFEQEYRHQLDMKANLKE